MSEIDPSNREFYQSQAAQLSADAQELVATYLERFDQVKQKTFVTQHTAFSYLANRFGLKQLGIAGVSGQEPSVQQLQEVKNFVDRYKVQTIFTEPNLSDKAAQLIAQETGAQVKELNPLEADPQNRLSLLDNLKENLEQLYQVLKNEGDSIHEETH